MVLNMDIGSSLQGPWCVAGCSVVERGMKLGLRVVLPLWQAASLLRGPPLPASAPRW